MDKKPLVSVITPVYNSAPFIADTVASVMAQTLGDWEMLVIDDSSTDGSLEVLREVAGADKRIRLTALSHNSGAAVARNTAIEQARGRYLAFLDSDDIWYPQKLAKQIRFMEENEYVLTHTYYEKINEAGTRTNVVVRPPARLSYTDMLKSNQMGCLSTIYDTKKLGKVYMPLIRARQDYGLWLELLRREPFAYCLPESLALYRVRTGSASSNKLEMLKYNWSLYRSVEKLSVFRSGYYLGWNILRKMTNARS